MDILPEDIARADRNPARRHRSKARRRSNTVFPAISTAQFALAEPRDAAEMTEMMKALNIDPVEAEFQYRRLYYAMEANCAGCRDKERCRADLARNTAAENFRDYCDNEALLNEMRAEPDMLREEG